KGDDDVDAKRFETVDRKTRFVPREERTRACDWDRSVDHIRASSHNGCIQRPDTWLHPNVSRKRQILFPCTVGAVHTWHYPESPGEHELSPVTEVQRKSRARAGPCGTAGFGTERRFPLAQPTAGIGGTAHLAKLHSGQTQGGLPPEAYVIVLIG